MNEYLFPKSRIADVKPKIIFVHDGTDTQTTAFSSPKSASLALLLPRVLGVLSVSANITDESGRELLYEADFEWVSLSSGLDRYELDLPSELLTPGLYLFTVRVYTPLGAYSLVKRTERILGLVNGGCGDVFQFTIADFQRIQRSPGGVIYHVFVDRFNRGGRSIIKQSSEYPKDWEVIPEFPEYPGAYLKNNTLFGGTLDGIREKLPYIASLGTSIIYLSPVFESVSNHKYDTADYMSVDSSFGGDDALADLINEARKYGIDVILDGVFNHTGADSLYFNKYARYDTVGAYQSQKSPYYSWYDFKAFPDDYTSWWGIEILPRINPDKPECREYFIGDGGVVEKYAKMGVRGFRLDVADELSDDFIKEIKAKLLSVSENALLYGEVWEDASNKIAYGRRKKYYLGDELDGVMNYPLREGIIDYLKNKSTEKIEYALTTVLNNAPKRIRDTQMNLLGTHDTERILTVLGGKSGEGRTNAELAISRMTENERAHGVRLLKIAYTALATLPGIPAVFYGDEVGLEGYGDPFNRMPYPWGKEDAELLSHYRKIGKLRKVSTAYRDGEFKLLHLDTDLLLFTRQRGKYSYLTLINNSDKMIDIFLDNEAKILHTDGCNKQSHIYHIEPISASVIKLPNESNIYIL